MPQFACQPFIEPDDVYDKCGCKLNADEDEPLILEMIDMASDMLMLATGGVVTGVCTVTVRPVALCDDWYLGAPAHHDNRRRFGGLTTIPLRGPRTDVVSVSIDGITLSPTEYGLVDERFLFRRSGCWPTCNDLTLLSGLGVFEIVQRFGRPPDVLTRLAATELTCELVRDFKGMSNRLPPGVSSLNVQGAQMSHAQDYAESLRAGQEQIPVVARLLSLYDPTGVGSQSAVWSPELEQSWNLVQVEGPSGS